MLNKYKMQKKEPYQADIRQQHVVSLDMLTTEILEGAVGDWH